MIRTASGAVPGWKQVSSSLSRSGWYSIGWVRLGRFGKRTGWEPPGGAGPADECSGGVPSGESGGEPRIDVGLLQLRVRDVAIVEELEELTGDGDLLLGVVNGAGGEPAMVGEVPHPVELMPGREPAEQRLRRDRVGGDASGKPVLEGHEVTVHRWEQVVTDE